MPDGVNNKRRNDPRGRVESYDKVLSHCDSAEHCPVNAYSETPKLKISDTIVGDKY